MTHPSFTRQVQRYTSHTLSRAFLPNTDNAQGEFDRVNAVKLLPMTDERLVEMRTSTCDEVLQQLKAVIQTGWPKENQELPAVLAPYFSFRDEMSVYDNHGEQDTNRQTARQKQLLKRQNTFCEMPKKPRETETYLLLY